MSAIKKKWYEGNQANTNKKIMDRRKSDEKQEQTIKKKIIDGFAGLRSRYLPHARRTCYQVHHEPFSFLEFSKKETKSRLTKIYLFDLINCCSTVTIDVCSTSTVTSK